MEDKHGSTIQGTRISSFKTVLLGDASVGKSSLVIRFARNVYNFAMETTIGAAFFTKILTINDNPNSGEDSYIKFEIWDTAGQERFASLAPMYYRGAAAALVVFDQTNPKSFERAQFWVNELKKNAAPNIVIALIANKADLISGTPELITAEEYAKNNQLLFQSTSAKTGQNVRKAFVEIAQQLKSQHDAETAVHAGTLDDKKKLYSTIQLNSKETKNSLSRCCSYA